MEKKYLTEFVGLFDKFSFAVGIVARECGCTCAPDPTYLANEINKLNALSDDLTRCRQLYSGHYDWNILYCFLEEVEKNLYLNSTDRVIYVKSIIRKFINITPYTNINGMYCVENSELGICSNRAGKLYNYLYYIHKFFSGNTVSYVPQGTNDIHTINVVRSFFDAPDRVDSISKKYLNECNLSIDFFAGKLDNICRQFDIDFLKAQDDLGIYLQVYRGYNSNGDYIYFELETENQLSAETSSTLISDGGNKILVPSTLGRFSEEKTKDLHVLSLEALSPCSLEEFIYFIIHPTSEKLVSRQQGKTFILITALLAAEVISDVFEILHALGKDKDKYYRHPTGNANNKAGGTEYLFAKKLEELLNIRILDN
ncbi:MAG: hypothetical protein RSB69_11930 [Odoribacter sp.]